MFKDVIGFVRPVDFSGSDTPAEASSLAQPLRYSQGGFDASQFGIEVRILWRYRGSRGQQLRRCGLVRGERDRRQRFLKIRIGFAGTFRGFGGRHGIGPVTHCVEIPYRGEFKIHLRLSLEYGINSAMQTTPNGVASRLPAGVEFTSLFGGGTRHLP
jgi:hypothetical protein